MLIVGGLAVMLELDDMERSSAKHAVEAIIDFDYDLVAVQSSTSIIRLLLINYS